MYFRVCFCAVHCFCCSVISSYSWYVSPGLVSNPDLFRFIALWLLNMGILLLPLFSAGIHHDWNVLFAIEAQELLILDSIWVDTGLWRSCCLMFSFANCFVGLCLFDVLFSLLNQDVACPLLKYISCNIYMTQLPIVRD